MSKKIERVFRDRPLSQAEAARDADIRRQVEVEFPPASNSNPQGPSRGADRMTLSHLLRRSIRDSGKPLETIARETGLSEILLARFLSGERDIRVATAEKLAESLGLNLTAS